MLQFGIVACGQGVNVMPSTEDIWPQRCQPASRYVPLNGAGGTGAGRSGNARCSITSEPPRSF
jgi:hypothetical protein